MGSTRYSLTPALQQIAIEHDVVRVPDHDDLGAGVAAFGQAVELGDDLLARQAALDDDEVRRRVFLIVRHRRLDAAHVHVDMRLGETAILCRDLQDLRHGDVLAEGLDRDARDRTSPRARRLSGENGLFARKRDVELVLLLGAGSGMGVIRHDVNDL